MKSKFRTKYEPRIVNTPMKDVKSLTDPQYKDDCTIDGIIKRYGVIPAPTVTPISADVSDYGDFAINLQRVNDALSQFQDLPSSIRERFGNDPRSFYEFVSNPANINEMVRLGLAEIHEEEESTTEILKEISKKLSPEKAIA